MTAHLDAQGGVQVEGEDNEPLTGEAALAIAVWNLLENGSGSIDWAGLPYAVALFGIQDIERLLMNLQTIRCHEPQKDAP